MRNLAVTLPDTVEHKTTLSISIKKQLKKLRIRIFRQPTTSITHLSSMLPSIHHPAKPTP